MLTAIILSIVLLFKRSHKALIMVVALCLSSLSEPQAAVSIIDRNSSSGWEITSLSEAETVSGRSRKITYSNTGRNLTNGATGIGINIDAGDNPFSLLRWCMSSAPSTAAGALVVTVQRRTSAASFGSVGVAEGTTSGNQTTAVFDFQRDGAAQGRGTGVQNGAITFGTAGAILDRLGFTTLEPGGTDQYSAAMFCRSYDKDSGKAPLIPGGIVNGISISTSNVSGSTASASMTSITILEDLPQ